MKPSAIKKIISFRKIKDIDIASFKKDIRETEPAENVENFVDQYNRTLADILDKHVPLKTKHVFIRQNTPWFTDEISKAKKRTSTSRTSMVL